MSNSNKILNQFTTLYHGSKNGELRKDEKHKYNCLYVTPIFAYAAMYSTDSNSTHGCVFEMTPIRPLNIFDANDENALEQLKAKVIELNPGNTLVNQIKWNDLKTKDWSTVCFRRDKIRDDLLLKAVKTLGYDGYVNIEWDEGCAESYAEGLGGCIEVVNSISIGIFDENLLEVVDEKYFDDYSDDELFNKCHQADEDLFIKFLQDEGLGDFYYDDEASAKDWAADNLPFLDADEVNNLFDTYANCYDDEARDFDESSKKKNLTSVLGTINEKKLTEKYIISTIDDETGKRMYWNNGDGVWYYGQSQGTTYENYDEASLNVPEADLNLPSDSIYPVEVLESSKRWSKMKESRVANANEDILKLMDYFISDLQDRGYRKITPVRGSGKVAGPKTFFVVDSTDTVKRIEVSVDGQYEDDIIAMFDRYSGGVVGSSIYQLCTADPNSADPSNPELIWWAGKTKEDFINDLADMWKVVKSQSPRMQESKKIKERVLDFDTYDKYYDEGAEAYFEGKSLSEVPITGNAWFREAWEEGWKNAKAYDEEDARRLEAEYEDELEQEEACREGLIESENSKLKKLNYIEPNNPQALADFIQACTKDGVTNIQTRVMDDSYIMVLGEEPLKESRRRFHVYDREISSQMDSILGSKGIIIKPQTTGQGFALYSIKKPNLQVGELMFTPAAYYLAGPRENIYWEGSTLEEFETDVEDMAYAVREIVDSL